MPAPKAGALPLGDAPKDSVFYVIFTKNQHKYILFPYGILARINWYRE